MRKELLFPVIIAVLFLTVGVFSFLLLFFKRNPQLIRHKIKIGLIIISLQALMTGCGSAVQTSEEISCYAKPIEPDIMSLVNPHYKDGKYIYNKETDSIYVNVSERIGTHFSYAILDETGKEVMHGELKAKDTLLDKAWEELFVPLPSGIESGTYQLVFYNSRIKDTVVKINRRASYPIIIN